MARARLRGKRGYFFVIDAFIGATILFVTLILLLSTGIRTQSTTQPFTTLESFTSFISSTQIRDLNMESTNGYVLSGVINNTRSTVLEQLTLWDYQRCSACRNYSTTVLSDLAESVDAAYGLSITLNNTLLYNRSVAAKERAVVHLTTRHISMIVANGTFYGPVLLEVSLWT